MTAAGPSEPGWLDQIEAALDAATQWDDAAPPRLTEAVRYSLLGGGKRLRPRLVVYAFGLARGDLAGEAGGGLDSGIDPALPAAVAVEMVHAYSLIHDDLPAMDDDELRRGRPTCHLQYDEATAILAGDALLTEAFAQLATLRPGIAARAVAVLARAAGRGGMVGGQMADLIAETQPVTRAAALQQIHQRKTGALITAALELGGLCGEADEATLAALTRYGRAVGLLFQITDDLLDACGDPVVMGKNARKDTDRGKATYPGLLGLDASRRRAADLADEAAAALDGLDRAADPLRRLARSLVNRTT